MKYFDATFPAPAENLACDEALLDVCDAAPEGEILRFWEPATPFVVVGYANQAQREVNLPACKAHDIGVFRRCSGGGTVLQGPGCLNYSLILRIDRPPGGVTPNPLTSISGTNMFVLKRHQLAFESLLQSPVRIQGHTDLSIRDLKFSGNAQRRKRHCLIFHGTFLLNFDLATIEQFLPLPSQQPFYRQGRPHAAFLTNLNLPATEVKAALRQAWAAHTDFMEVPRDAIQQLAREKYSTEAWNTKF